MHATVAIGKVRRGGNHRCTQSSPFFPSFLLLCHHVHLLLSHHLFSNTNYSRVIHTELDFVYILPG